MLKITFRKGCFLLFFLVVLLHDSQSATWIENVSNFWKRALVTAPNPSSATLKRPGVNKIQFLPVNLKDPFGNPLVGFDKDSDENDDTKSSKSSDESEESDEYEDSDEEEKSETHQPQEKGSPENAGKERAQPTNVSVEEEEDNEGEMDDDGEEEEEDDYDEDPCEFTDEGKLTTNGCHELFTEDDNITRADIEKFVQELEEEADYEENNSFNSTHPYVRSSNDTSAENKESRFEEIPIDLDDLDDDIAQDIEFGVDESLKASDKLRYGYRRPQHPMMSYPYELQHHNFHQQPVHHMIHQHVNQPYVKCNHSSHFDDRRFTVHMYQGQYFPEPRLNRFIEGIILNMMSEVQTSNMDPLYFRVLRTGRKIAVTGGRLRRPLTKNKKIRRRRPNRRRPVRRRPGKRRRKRRRRPNGRPIRRRPGKRRKRKRRPNRNKKKRPQRQRQRRSLPIGGGRVQGLSKIRRDGDAEMQAFGNYTLIRSHYRLGFVELRMAFRTRRGIRRTGASMDNLRAHAVTRVSPEGSEMIDFVVDSPPPESIEIRGALFPLARRIARRIFSSLFRDDSFLVSHMRSHAAASMLSKPVVPAAQDYGAQTFGAQSFIGQPAYQSYGGQPLAASPYANVVPPVTIIAEGNPNFRPIASSNGNWFKRTENKKD